MKEVNVILVCEVDEDGEVLVVECKSERSAQERFKDVPSFTSEPVH
jgi:hypothetical protein